MAKLQGLSKLAKALDNLKMVAEQIRENLDEKREWWYEKSDTWQESDKGQEWDEHLCDIENLLDEIGAIEIPDYE